MFSKPVLQFVNRHTVHAWFTFIRTNPPVCTPEVLGVAYLFHQIDCQGWMRRNCRRRLLRSMRGGDEFARPARAVVVSAFLLLYVHRKTSLCLALKDSALRPVELLWPLLTSLFLSRRITPTVVRCER